MQFVELKKKEFDHFSSKHTQGTFQQSSMWASFKEGEEWQPYYVGLKQQKKLIAATLLLSHELKKGKEKVFYAPRGFLIDYHQEDLLQEFSNQVINFIKERQGILLKIDPYVFSQERNQEDILNHLKQMGFIKVLKEDLIQPKWLYHISLKGKTMKHLLSEMTPKTRQIIRRNEQIGFSVRELKKEEFPLYQEMARRKSEKYHTIQYEMPFYEDLYEAFGKNHMKIIVAELEFDIILYHLHQKIKQLEEEKEERVKNYHTTKMSEEHFIHRELQEAKQKEDLIKNVHYFEELKMNTQKKSIILGGYLFLIFGGEIVALDGAMEEEWLKLDASYILHYAVLKWALKKGYSTYNFYEIPGYGEKDDPQSGSYHFKKNFGGNVVELIGEFDYPIDQQKYKKYKQNFPQYYGVKTLKRQK